MDQPLYTLAKQIQWSWPASHGEDQFVVMFCGLHIETAALKALGDLLESSGWTHAPILASLATTGTADSFLKASHVTRTRRAHQITTCSLYLLQQKAYTENCNGVEEGCNRMSLEDFCDQWVEACPLFLFWSIILQLELEVMIYVKAIRTDQNCSLVLRVGSHQLRQVTQPVHLRDMVFLHDMHPGVFAEFRKGNVIIKKTTHVFSGIAIGQAHEQNKASVKGDGGAVGLSENPAALLRWMVSGPEMARLFGEFEVSTKKIMKTYFRHHEQRKHAQVTLGRDITSVIEEMGNPIAENSKDLLVLDSRDLVDPAVIDTLRQIKSLGQEQYDTYVNERLVNQTKPITDPIKRNNLPLFSRPPVREKSRAQLQLSSLKNDCSLFSRLYIAS